jgi:hypothetical protein
VLEAAVAEWSDRGAEIVVVTHHMPSFSLTDSRYRGDPLNCCFANNFDEFIAANPTIKAWIYGHTHAAGTQVIGRTVCAINARGYPKGGAEVAGYSPEKVLTFGWVSASAALPVLEDDKEKEAVDFL